MNAVDRPDANAGSPDRPEGGLIAAPSYERADDLAIVTCHFNPLRFLTKLANYRAFREPIDRSGLSLFVLEQAGPDARFELPHGTRLTRCAGGDPLWQKERLLNVVIESLPARYDKIAWIDADLLFTNPYWAVDASALLENYRVVQLFETAIRLPPKTRSYVRDGEVHESFAAVYAKSPNAALAGRYDRHGHSGFAWAARRDALPLGLYDACIAGSGDHAMAHAFIGDWDSGCMERTFGRDGAMMEHFRAWAGQTYERVRARVGVVPGTVLHLWHGDMVNRRYADRNSELLAMGFDPFEDVEIDGSGCWRWRRRRDELAAWTRRYFENRREDSFATPEQRLTRSSGF